MARFHILAVGLLALAAPAVGLAQQAPQLKGTAPAVAPPAAPAPKAATPSTPAANTVTAAAVPATPTDDLPKGAPSDDYQFTAWCYGLIRQHVELYPAVKQELDAISKRLKTEAEDAKLWAETLADHQAATAKMAKAMEAAEKASPRPINAVGARARDLGRSQWDDMSKVDKSLQAYSWMNFGVPDRCNRVATALENRSVLFGQALQANTPAANASQGRSTATPVPPATNR